MELEEIFVVSQINEDAILGMPFLARHDCKMDFARPVVTIGEHELVCTDQFERLIASHVQIIRRTAMPLQIKVALSCRLTSHNHAPERLIESLSHQVVLANSIKWPGAKGDVIVRCINPTNQLLKLTAGFTIGTFMSFDQQDITEDNQGVGSQKCCLQQIAVESRGSGGTLK